ncbi:hypothetical protein BPAE_0027g00560 [Botrytis paeoniae]|uniref:Uncharacterized protein n=1 Tax=Botrytis paeoniae TaxID=278948 RepID=A0A4Z1G031_9HELO|nr:hypothetical protein BPAE_0027g00560 [Botrytis paeoniae]
MALIAICPALTSLGPTYIDSRKRSTTQITVWNQEQDNTLRRQRRKLYENSADSPCTTLRRDCLPAQAPSALHSMQVIPSHVKLLTTNNLSGYQLLSNGHRRTLLLYNYASNDLKTFVKLANIKVRIKQYFAQTEYRNARNFTSISIHGKATTS